MAVKWLSKFSFQSTKTHVLAHIVFPPDQPPATNILPLRARTYLSSFSTFLPLEMRFGVFQKQVCVYPQL